MHNNTFSVVTAGQQILGDSEMPTLSFQYGVPYCLNEAKVFRLRVLIADRVPIITLPGPWGMEQMECTGELELEGELASGVLGTTTQEVSAKS